MIICLFIHLFVSDYAHEKQKAIKLLWTGRGNIKYLCFTCLCSSPAKGNTFFISCFNAICWTLTYIWYLKKPIENYPWLSIWEAFYALSLTWVWAFMWWVSAFKILIPTQYIRFSNAMSFRVFKFFSLQPHHGNNSYMNFKLSHTLIPDFIKLTL